MSKKLGETLTKVTKYTHQLQDLCDFLGEYVTHNTASGTPYELAIRAFRAGWERGEEYAKEQEE